MLPEFSSTVGFMVRKYQDLTNLQNFIVTKSLDSDRQALDSYHRIRIHKNDRNTEIGQNLFNHYPLLTALSIVCRWFRFAQLAKGKKSRP